ncbi:MAG: hypothetical protein K9J37_14825 [Saprospiraceae bacterium]|nr:hypothetical protein [Saprospiraceae bacterium]MCF8251182.1 hypothetical protein [Saprospiraceae bacterium]MCF8282385.1 hypothetical protein [Bacteroidales bacterium]MCF8312994.1 hypothetical protein [Saprospiraceae bacterium]MCF8441441.1 hypothetical protein [Saprospiraceae bacterium]
MNLSKSCLLFSVLFLFSCKKDKPDAPIVEPDCKYQFEPNLADIYGVWEPKQIINLEDGDTTNYNIGKGHTGFMLYDHYADSFELRPDSTLALYYVESGRFCASRDDGTWYMASDTIYISRYPTDNKKLPIIALSQTELVLVDTVNFKLSKATYRKIN